LGNSCLEASLQVLEAALFPRKAQLMNEEGVT
jgi:hypothetical protein